MNSSATNEMKSAATDMKEAAGLSLLTLDNPTFSCYLFWASLLVIKMLLMSLITGGRRFCKKTYANPEDLSRTNTEIKFHDPDVERVRRAHRNDLENVLPFLIMGLIYTATGPHSVLARILFRIVAVARILHTCVYAFRPVPQPSRLIAFLIPLLITIYMAVYTIVRTIVYI